MIPPGVPGDRLLVLIDLSWWLTRAWHGALSAILGDKERPPGPETERDHRLAARKMLATACGWLASLLTPPLPACVAAALDSIGPTFRHELTAHLPEERRYKATRSARPLAYREAVNVFLEILCWHGVPLLSAEGFEADDVIATATGSALLLGLNVAIVSGDKDLGALVYLDPVYPGVWQWAWSGAETAADIRGPKEIRDKLLVWPWMVPDMLAIVGDKSDNVPGAEGVGIVWAAKILELASHYRDQAPAPTLIGTALDLMPVPPTDDAIDAAEKAHARLRRAKPNALSDEAMRSRAEQITEAKARLDGLRYQRDLAKRFEMVQRARETVLLARQLVTLRTDAPLVGWEPERLPVGGFDVDSLRELYRSLDFHQMAAELRPMAKRPLEEFCDESIRWIRGDRRREADGDQQGGAHGVRILPAHGGKTGGS